jgi:hypothetical protein
VFCLENVVFYMILTVIKQLILVTDSKFGLSEWILKYFNEFKLENVIDNRKIQMELCCLDFYIDVRISISFAICSHNFKIQEQFTVWAQM